MGKYFFLLVLLSILTKSFAQWETGSTGCPITCTCQLQHLTETAIYRFMQKDKSKNLPGETAGSVENNEVLYDDEIDSIELLEDAHRSIVIRSATCILQTETYPVDLIDSLPENIEILTLIQGYESGNKTILFSYLKKFPRLMSLEVIGPNMVERTTNSHLLCKIDTPLPDLKYINLERVAVQNSIAQLETFLKQVDEENVTFEFVQKFENSVHSITLVQKSINDDDIVPYTVFKEQKKIHRDAPVFVGFKNLVLLRIKSCELNSIYWEMFDGLSELHYLILENNNLRFIPAFAFYGTPNLRTLSLAHNNLLDIQVTDLAGLLQLEYLDLSYNNFTQLSEVSLPPFPKLKLANFANNPVSIVFPNTFEVMNTTEALNLGSNDMPMKLMPNSFAGLSMLKSLTLNNLIIEILKRDFFTGMSRLQELHIQGNISKIEYDAFLEVPDLIKLVLSNCQIYNISMDAFIGLQKLLYLDLSRNNLEYLPPGVFDHLTRIKELYLNGNKFTQVARDLFSHIHPKMIRLNENPWHCSCAMSEWKPMVINKVKQRSIKPCEYTNDKGVSCSTESRFELKYVYDNKIAPKCASPGQFLNWNVFHAMRRIFKCPAYKPKIKRRRIHLANNTNKAEPTPLPKSYNETLRAKKLKKLNSKLHKGTPAVNYLDNSEISNESSVDNSINNVVHKVGKYKHRRGRLALKRKFSNDISM